MNFFWLRHFARYAALGGLLASAALQLADSPETSLGLLALAAWKVL